MGSVSATNPASNQAISQLLQQLSNENSPLLSTFASPAVESALQNAPPSDIIQISDQAFQLQETDALFGQTGTTSTASPADSFFSQLEAIGSGTTSTPSLADQASAFQGNSQLQQIQSLFGITPPGSTPANSLFDVLA
jgi:hypothetical protein